MPVLGLSFARLRPLRSLRRSDIQIRWADELILGVILNGGFPFPGELIAIHQGWEDYLDLTQGEVKANAGAWPSCKRYVGALRLFLGVEVVPAIGVEAVGVVPYIGIRVDCIQRNDQGRPFRKLVSARDDTLSLGDPSGLERRVM